MNISFIISKIEANYTLVILVSTLIRRLKWEVKRSQSKKWGKHHKFDNDTHTRTHTHRNTLFLCASDLNLPLH